MAAEDEEKKDTNTFEISMVVSLDNLIATWSDTSTQKKDK